MPAAIHCQPIHHCKLGAKQTDITFVKPLARVNTKGIQLMPLLQVTYCCKSCRADRLEPKHTSSLNDRRGSPLGMHQSMGMLHSTRQSNLYQHDAKLNLHAIPSHSSYDETYLFLHTTTGQVWYLWSRIPEPKHVAVPHQCVD